MIRFHSTVLSGAVLVALSGCGDSPEGPANTSAATEPGNAAIAAAPQPTPTPVPAEAAEDAGRYTSLAPADCRLIAENREEGGYARHACPGLGGYKLETSESDLRQDVVVIAPDGRRSELNLSSLVAKGAFNALGRTAEWRGPESNPRALIFRLNVAPGPDPVRPDISNLVVARLAGAACAVAVVPPGAGQNARARAIADGEPLPSCIQP